MNDILKMDEFDLIIKFETNEKDINIINIYFSKDLFLNSETFNEFRFILKNYINKPIDLNSLKREMQLFLYYNLNKKNIEFFNFENAIMIKNDIKKIKGVDENEKLLHMW